MIELTVRTLDSQNHPFSVEDDITVEQFKVKIAETVNIPPETQRIIYCGRVLQDNSKLSDYDVNGKVVHLVQRAPPSNQNRSSRTASPQPQRRGFRGFEHGNAMYLGSMAFPSNLMESQGIVPPPPTHTLAGSRLNVARRMLRRAEAVIRLLENPSARPSEQAPPEDNQEEEVTPVIEARVIVPSNNSEPIDEAMVLSAVQNSLLNAAGTMNNRETSEDSEAPQPNTENQNPETSTSTPENDTSRTSSTENLASESRPEANNANSLAENASRTTEMAELLTMLSQLQLRFAPFLERYQTFMQEDPVVSTENVRSTQAMLSRVSEVLHFLGHAYHSLSDIIIRVRTPPPRPLLCRPILIQHSAVVQAGIPIQVEAQINLSAERPPATTTASASDQAGTNETSSESSTPESPINQQTSNNSNAPRISAQFQPHSLVSIPFVPGASMRVQSFPVEIRAVSRPSGTAMPQRQQNNNNNVVNGTENSTPTTTTPSTAPSAPPPPTEATSTTEGAAPFNFNNPNVEFFMEVTPEGITIDSLETTLVGSNQANDLLRGALNGPPPEFLQSLMQMAGQIINRSATTTASATTASTTAAPSTESSQSSQSNVPPQPASAGQNSQARGNTQTNPTTATHTRSTARPHVHLAQQAMQGGFDPFLPCNSHHVTTRRRIPVQNLAPTSTNTSNASRSEGTGGRAPNQNIYNFINGIMNTFRTAYTRRNAAETSAQPSTTTTTNASNVTTENTTSSGSGTTESPLPPFASLFNSTGGLPDLIQQGPTLEQLLQQFHQDEPYVQGESIITDFIMVLVRNLTLVDLFTLNSGNVEPIGRNSAAIREFFLTRILDGNSNPENLQRGTERIISEMQPFFENFRGLDARDNIDMVRSVENLFRLKLPVILEMAARLEDPTDTQRIRLLLDACIATVKELCGLTLLASSNGQQGVEQVFEQIMNRFMQDIPREVQEWTLMTSRIHLQQVMRNLRVNNNVEEYIIRAQNAISSAVPVRQPNEVVGDNTTYRGVDEEMEVDEQEVANTENELGSSVLKLEETEPLPNIVIGSDPWHSQVPEEWVPIIARDAQKQRRQNTQQPFSDAYLSGMPSKRRKLINSSKPQGSLPQVITESVRHAVTSTGLSNAAPLEVVAEAAGASPEIQAAYRNLLRTTVQANIRDNEDFTPERFPNATSYFNNPPQ